MNTVEPIIDAIPGMLRRHAIRHTALILLLVSLLGSLLFASASLRQERIKMPDAAFEPISVFPDFASITDVDSKKRMFFSFLEGYIAEQNKRVAGTRRRIHELSSIVADGLSLSDEERAELVEISSVYLIDHEEMRDPELLFELLKRVDSVPVALALAQAANESAWGTSRFALEANNIFGHWCYDEGCGVVPNRRGANASHELRAFASIEHAVRAYFMNLNTHEQYQNFRNMRFQMRNQRGELDALVLAFGLEGYSERGDKYVDEIQTIIQQNDLVNNYGG